MRRRKLHGGSGISPLGASDPVTGLYYERARWYSPSLGTWISQDPAGYINGADTYQFVGDGPVGRVDAGGTSHALVTNNFPLAGWWATFHVVVRANLACPAPSAAIAAQYWTGFQTVAGQRYSAVVIPFGNTITKGPCQGGLRTVTDAFHYEVKSFVTIGLWKFGLTVPDGTWQQVDFFRTHCKCCGGTG